MQVIKHVPLVAFLLIAYNILALVSGVDTEKNLSTVLFQFTLISGAVFKLDVNALLIIMGLHILYVEILKSIKTSLQTVIKHVLSTLVFMIFVIEFIVVKDLGTPSFLVLTMMAMLDLIQGFTVTISSARRDVIVDH